jgi:DNA-binding MarR family transcriptional regulator
MQTVRIVQNDRDKPAGMLNRVRRSAPKRATRLDLRRFLPFLINHLGGRWVTVFSGTLHRGPLGYTAWRVLATLSYFEQMQLNELAQIAHFDLSTLSRVIVGLEKKGYIVRLPSRRAGRAVPIKLSESGVRYMEEYLPVALDAEKGFLAELSPQEQRQLGKLLFKLFESESFAARLRLP